MPRPVTEPNIFGSLSGIVSASLLDQNFAALTAITNDSASGWSNAAYDVGVANGYAVNLTPPAVGYQNGFLLSFVAANQNTGASSLNVNGLGNIPLTLLDGSALTVQMILAGWLYTVMYIGGSFRILSPCGGPMVGTIGMSASNTTFSPGWIGAYGQAVPRATYPALFAAIGTAYGSGDGSSTFNTPNYSGRFPTYATPGTMGGASSVALAVGNLPPHAHPITDQQHTHSTAASDSGHVHQYPQPLHSGGTQTAAGSGFTSGAENTGMGYAQISVSLGASYTNIKNTDVVGSGAAFSIYPPYTGCTFLIKCYPLIS